MLWSHLERMWSSITIKYKAQSSKRIFWCRLTILSSWVWATCSRRTKNYSSSWGSLGVESCSLTWETVWDSLSRELRCIPHKWLRLLVICTLRTSFTETWSPRTFWWTTMATSVWLTSVLLKCSRTMPKHTPSVEPLSTSPPKFWTKKDTASPLTGGLWECWHMKWSLDSLPFTQEITRTTWKCMSWSRRSPYTSQTPKGTKSICLKNAKTLSKR